MLQRLEYIQPEITKLNYVVEVPTHLQESYTRQRHVAWEVSTYDVVSAQNCATV